MRACLSASMRSSDGTGERGTGRRSPVLDWACAEGEGIPWKSKSAPASTLGSPPGPAAPGRAWVAPGRWGCPLVAASTLAGSPGWGRAGLDWGSPDREVGVGVPASTLDGRGVPGRRGAGLGGAMGASGGLASTLAEPCPPGPAGGVRSTGQGWDVAERWPGGVVPGAPEATWVGARSGARRAITAPPATMRAGPEARSRGSEGPARSRSSSRSRPASRSAGWRPWGVGRPAQDGRPGRPGDGPKGARLRGPAWPWPSAALGDDGLARTGYALPCTPWTRV